MKSLALALALVSFGAFANEVNLNKKEIELSMVQEEGTLGNGEFTLVKTVETPAKVVLNLKMKVQKTKCIAYAGPVFGRCIEKETYYVVKTNKVSIDFYDTLPLPAGKEETFAFKAVQKKLTAAALDASLEAVNTYWDYDIVSGGAIDTADFFVSIK